MGWKNIKDHYRIGHIVQIREGRIAIGSGYVSDLLRVTFDGKVSWGNLGPSSNDDLARYHAEMTADPAKLLDLIQAPDTFTQSLTVFTYDGGQILEKQCEAYDWPNVTHDGLLMYDNLFSPNRDDVIRWAKKNACCGVKAGDRRIKETHDELDKIKSWRGECEADLAKLNADYPDIILPDADEDA